jgi:thiosulfate/3-mercaptopyruvate sulfurtransferase
VKGERRQIGEARTGSPALADPLWLEAHLGDPQVRVIALDWEGRRSYDRGHIPGALYWDWKEMLWDPLKRDFPTPEVFAERCAAAGIANDTTVVFYGEPAVQFGTYAWWVFRYCGHRDARLLDGARLRWEREGRPLTAEVPAIEPALYLPRRDPGTAQMRASRDAVLHAIGRSDVVILDHRSLEEYRGERLSPPGSPNHGAERLGRIPGARHLYFAEMVAPDTRFREAGELRAMLERCGASADKTIISYCRLSHRASLAYFAMTELLGYGNVRVYDGSWTEWGSLVGYPIER